MRETAIQIMNNAYVWMPYDMRKAYTLAPGSFEEIWRHFRANSFIFNDSASTKDLNAEILAAQELLATESLRITAGRSFLYGGWQALWRGVSEQLTQRFIETKAAENIAVPTMKTMGVSPQDWRADLKLRLTFDAFEIHLVDMPDGRLLTTLKEGLHFLTFDLATQVAPKRLQTASLRNDLFFGTRKGLETLIDTASRIAEDRSFMVRAIDQARRPVVADAIWATELGPKQ